MLRFLLLLSFVSVLNGQKSITVNCCNNNVTCNASDEELPLPTIFATRNGSGKFLYKKPSAWTINTITGGLQCGSYRLESVSNSGSPNFFLKETGELLLYTINQKIAPNKFCFVNKTLAYYCTNETIKVTVKKCCGKGAVFSEIKQSCITMNVTDYKIDIGTEKRLAQGFPNCEFSRHVIAGKLQHLDDLLTNGSIILPESNVLLAEGEFCLEHVLEDAVAPSILTCNHHIPTTTARPLPEPDIRLKIYPFALLLSAIFLAATLVAGAALPAVHHHALHWRCQTNHVACLLVGDVLLAATQLAGTNVNSIVCVAIAFIMHFSFLAAFFWLNTMCFNIWWTFRDLRPGTLEKRQERCRLRIYGVYAWGVPFIISMIALTLHTIPDGTEYTFLRPRFGEKNCWFPGNTEIFTYFYGPIGLLLLINLLLFAATARELTCGLWKRELVKSTTERAALGRVCMKLVIVMGVTWIADILSWAVGGPKYLWYITDLINALQGLFIFIVVACQPQVWTALKRLWCKRQSLAADITGNGNHHSSSSHGYGLPSESVTNHSVSNTTRSVPIETSC